MFDILSVVNLTFRFRSEICDEHYTVIFLEPHPFLHIRYLKGSHLGSYSFIMLWQSKYTLGRLHSYDWADQSAFWQQKYDCTSESYILIFITTDWKQSTPGSDYTHAFRLVCVYSGCRPSMVQSFSQYIPPCHGILRVNAVYWDDSTVWMRDGSIPESDYTFVCRLVWVYTWRWSRTTIQWIWSTLSHNTKINYDFVKLLLNYRVYPDQIMHLWLSWSLSTLFVNYEWCIHPLSSVMSHNTLINLADVPF